MDLASIYVVSTYHPRQQIMENLQRKYGTDLTSEFVTVPELLGGLRVRVGVGVGVGVGEGEGPTVRLTIGAYGPS